MDRGVLLPLDLTRLPIEMRRTVVHMQQDGKSTKEVQQLLSEQCDAF